MTGVNPVLAGVACRCPYCGKGPLFRGFLSVAPGCPSCGADFSKLEAGDGPAVFIILIVGAIVCFSALALEIAARPPIWVHLVLWLPLAGGLSLLLMRPFKGVMVALQVHNRASEARHDH